MLFGPSFLSWSLILADPDAILSDLDFEGWFFCESQLTAPWGLALPGGRLAALHAVLEGRCRIDLRGNGVARELQAGDVAFLPLDTPHALRSGPDVEAIHMPGRTRFVGSGTSSATERLYATLLHELTH
ncbi:MAG: cupin domain-containing protein [Methylocystis sp.]|nr:cupin domain-containing protein [Methylocystis sp.]